MHLHPGHSLGQQVMLDVAAPGWLPVATGLEETVSPRHNLIHKPFWVMMRVHVISKSMIHVLPRSALEALLGDSVPSLMLLWEGRNLS